MGEQTHGTGEPLALSHEGYLIDYLAQADGTRNKVELDALFVEQYGPLYGPLLADRCWAFVEEQAGQLFDLDAVPRPTPSPVRVTGSEAGFFPTHSTLRNHRDVQHDLR